MSRTWDEILHDPRIDDTGNYDYYAEELPQDSMEWRRGECKCDSCGKYRALALVSKHYFYTYDGYDYLSYAECWRCRAKARLHRKKKKPTDFMELLKKERKTKWLELTLQGMEDRQEALSWLYLRLALELAVRRLLRLK